jgi:signal transduction histidine kinase
MSLRRTWLVSAGAASVSLGLWLGATLLATGAPPWPWVVLAAVSPFPLAAALSRWKRANGSAPDALAWTASLAVLSCTVIAVYGVIVLGLGRVPTATEQTLLLLSLAAAGASALLFEPVRRRGVALADRIAHGAHPAPDDVLHAFSTRSTRAIPLEELLLQLAESLRAALSLSAAEVWVGSSGAFERIASDPERGPKRLALTAEEEATAVHAGVSGPAWMEVWMRGLLEGRAGVQLRMAPSARAGALLGFLVAERPADAGFSADDERVLAEIAREVGLTLHNAQLDSALRASLEELRRQADELRASRARVVAAGDAERRRIERNLHDGAQQRLIALAVKARLARELVPSSPEGASAVLDELRGDAERAIDELRALAHGIYPQDLVERGLRVGLATAARELSPPAKVDAGATGRYASEVEAAVYFSCLEALQNVAKHAGNGAQATISLREEEGALVFEVADDGLGFDPRTERGAGLAGMADRIGGIGGRLRVESTRGSGTRVVGTVPLYPSSDDR